MKKLLDSFRKHKWVNLAQIMFTSYMIYRGVSWGLDGNWGKVNWCIFGVAFGFIAFHFIKFQRDMAGITDESQDE